MRGVIFVGGRWQALHISKLKPPRIKTRIELVASDLFLSASPLRVTNKPNYIHQPKPRQPFLVLVIEIAFTNINYAASLQRIRKLRKVRPAVKAGLPLSDSGNAAHTVAKQQLYTNRRGGDAGVDHHDVRVCGNVVLHFSLTPALRSLH